MTDHIALLGPVFHHWIARLDLHLSYLARMRGRRALLCARAGKRIGDLLTAHAGADTPYGTDLFGISRIAACKAVLPDLDAFQTVHDVTFDSLAGHSLGDLSRAYLREVWDDSDPRMASLGALPQPYDRDSFRTLLAANDPAARFLRDHLAACRAGLIRWLDAHKQDGSGFVLVDSGWKGSIQRLLAKSLPDYGFEGLYFGVMDSVPLPNRHGLVFDAMGYDAAYPETAFTQHRHLIESILEPADPSVEALPLGPEDNRARAQLHAITQETPDPVEDALFLGILAHIRAHAGRPLDDIAIACRKALPLLAECLLTPTRADARALGGKPRSVDFGRSGAVPVLLPTPDTPASRRNDALWKQGQIALDYPAEQARRLQRTATGLADASAYFAGHQETAAPRSAAKRLSRRRDKAQSGWAGSVAVITRTKNRPLLLARAARSIAAQTYANYRWVIVNDGGDLAPVRAIIATSGVDPRYITLIENPRSLGMEAASNLGIRAVDTEFIVIHDDDDSWEPTFLAEMTAFLHRPRAIAAGFDGVICRAWRVSEQIDGDRVVIHSREAYMPWVSEVPLVQMAVGNFFAPISFLYRRSLFTAIGGYDETLPVLGDWRFNLDFLTRANIGVLDRYLSSYHHRDRAPTGTATADVYANSIVGGRDLHAQYFSVVTNAILRDPETPQGLKTAIANAHTQRVMEQQLNLLSATKSHAQGGPPRTPPLPTPDTARLPETDLAHIRRSIPATLAERHPALHPLGTALGYLAAGCARLPRLRKSLLPALFPLIASPADFDHIAYLRRHPSLWATRFNGPGEWRPYHHWLLHAEAPGNPRPTSPAPHMPSDQPTRRKQKQRSITTR